MYAVSSVNATEQSQRVGKKSELYQILLNVYNFPRGLQAVQKLCLHKFKGQEPSICFGPSVMVFFLLSHLSCAYTEIEEKSI